MFSRDSEPQSSLSPGTYDLIQSPPLIVMELRLASNQQEKAKIVGYHFYDHLT